MKKQLVDIREGLYVVQYRRAEDTANPPTVTVEPLRRPNPAIDILMPPGLYDDLLREPGTSLVIRSDGPGQVAVIVSPSRPGGSVAAEVSVMLIDDLIARALDNLAAAEQPSGAARPAAGRAKPPAKAPATVNLMHVSGRGDVQTDPGAWMPSAKAEAPIEGLALSVRDMALAGPLEYRVRVSGPNGRMSSWARDGIFVGSRGRSLALTGIGLRLTPADARRNVIHAEARFVGGASLRLSGPEVYLSGPTGYEALAALLVRVEAVDARQVAPEPARMFTRPAPAEPARPAAPPPSRVRVFRKDPA